MDLMKADLEGVMMNTQSCMDHSILAIFEDSTVESEDKIDVEEESESSLLTALTEILDSVEDDGGTLSPFDTLPDSEYLKDQKARNTLSEDRRRKATLRSSTVVFTQRRPEEEEEEEAQNMRRRHSPPRPFKTPYQKAIHCTASLRVRAEKDAEILASASLVNLVRLMHPYCLRVYREEDGTSWSRRTASSSSSSSRPNLSPALPSQGEILRYVKPSGDSDEEIDVDLLDEETTDGGRRNVCAEAAQLKSALVNRDACRSQAARDRKRVSFGPVQVTSIGDTEEEESDPNELTGEEEETLSPVDGSAPAPFTPPVCGPSGNQAEVTNNNAAPSSSGQVKAKSLSLQQYRQLRQTRLPLVEKQGNNTTKWPLLSETPKELPPFVFLQGTTKTHRDPPGTRNCGGKTLSYNAHHHRSKRSRTEPKAISPSCPVLDCTAAVENKPTAVSSDPPNPVLLPMPATRPAASRANCPLVPSTTSGSTEPPPRAALSVLPSIGLLHEIRKQLAKMEQPTSKLALNPNSESAGLLQIPEVSQQQAKPLPPQCPTTHTTVTSETRKPQSTECIQRPLNETESLPKTPQSLDPDVKFPSSLSNCARPSAPDNVLRPVVEEKEATGTALSLTCPEEHPPPSQPSCRVFPLLGDSGIEATDLTSLLEQFEETQEMHVLLHCEPAGPEARTGRPPSPNVPALIDLNLDAPQTTNPDILSQGVLLPPSRDTALRTQDHTPTKQQWKHSLLSTQRKQPVKPKTLAAFRSIQIIEPQPLPYKKTQTQSPLKLALTQASQMHLSSSSHVSSDHDYCAPQGLPVSATPPMGTSFPRTSCQADVPSERANASENQPAVLDTKLPVVPVPNFSEGGAELDYCTTMTTVEDGMKRCIFATPPPSPPRRGREKERRRRYRKSRRSDSGSNSPSSSSSSSSCSSSSCSSGSPSPKRKRYLRLLPAVLFWFTALILIGRVKLILVSVCCLWQVLSSAFGKQFLLVVQFRFSLPSPAVPLHLLQVTVQSIQIQVLVPVQVSIQIPISSEPPEAMERRGVQDERRVVYVGRIRRSMTHDELSERFSLIGQVESVSLHFRDRSDSYGFVTFYHMEDAFAAIESGSKLRRPDELPFDICFGGRRQFCKSDYADLDSTKDDEAHGKFEDLDFDSLLKQAQKEGKS
ncbi:unnamed protein product [Merluccius merluccius]